MKINRETIATLLSLTLLLSVHQRAEAVDILVEGTFSASAFTETGSYAVSPDPLSLTFSVIVTIDDATFDSNAPFSIETVLDSISPNPLTLGAETFTAGEISVRVSRDLSEDGQEFNEMSVALGIGSIGSLSARTNDFLANYRLVIDSSAVTAPSTLPLEGPVRLVNEPINGAIESSTIQSGSVTLSLVPDPSLSGFLYNPSANTFSVSIKGTPNTAYILVEADDLDFTNPDQKPIPLSGASATVGSIDGTNIVTDGNGNATIETVHLGTVFLKNRRSFAPKRPDCV